MYYVTLYEKLVEIGFDDAETCLILAIESISDYRQRIPTDEQAWLQKVSLVPTDADAFMFEDFPTPNQDEDIDSANSDESMVIDTKTKTGGKARRHKKQK